MVPSLLSPALAVSISEINGNRFLSPYQSESISNVEGLVTAKASSGFYLRSTSPDSADRTSESIYVYGGAAVDGVNVGDIITLSGTSSDNEVVPVVIGEDELLPPTEEFSSLDEGDVYSLPNNASQLSDENPVLEPDTYGMYFWESLSGELVSISGLGVIAKPNRYGDTWVVGDWPLTGENGRGELTMRANDSNPEAILIGSALDGTNNPTDTKLGDTVDDITGIITQVYGFYSILPLTALSMSGSNFTTASPTDLVSDGTCKKMSFGSYNVNNLEPDSDTLSTIAEHIATYMKSPALVILQEIQDNNGATDNGVTSANKTLSTLTAEIANKGGINYSFIDIDPADGEDGGEPGGNIRNAYLYDLTVIKLHNSNPGSSTDANDVLSGDSGLELKYNLGLIDPDNSAWESSRKPLAVAWEMVDGGDVFFTINVHLTSKGGGSSFEGDARPPVNGGVEKRISQAEAIATFTSNNLYDLDDVVDTPSTERYTYLYDMNSQQLDHMYVSEGFAKAEVGVEHLHLNTWVEYDAQASDHDPTVAVLDVCG
ncbi:endonuclease/exonuclease/phosphatase family protein [Aspergillus glaucus CBS 516.65]|uniref:Endonuclease/exonuclease/phosphatase domain-containing protein n=1 Tax=Aspergillus glaucus CBS 516.65 TaxID=1160497 RepID=A0A1L9V760_ASPGL|nr:hypothetical protein ASPGLDRAFT_61502 [Aspergillus glaucus CBS 516.65]OJJ79692.1 hypothetical protein ASPGLDRAFT_61502 [Aspergillus glaucus CBS 516.65]